MIRQMKQLGINAKFMGGDGICTSELPKLAGDAMSDELVYCAEAGGVEGDQIAVMEKFRTDFKAKYGADVQVYAPYVYDAVHVMAKAMVAANSIDPQTYLPALKAITHSGVTGNIAFDEKGDIKNGALTLMTYKGGARTTLAVIR
jgi:branched-chain amino acid transport system substrate-binding protein